MCLFVCVHSCVHAFVHSCVRTCVCVYLYVSTCVFLATPYPTYDIHTTHNITLTQYEFKYTQQKKKKNNLSKKEITRVHCPKKRASVSPHCPPPPPPPPPLLADLQRCKSLFRCQAGVRQVSALSNPRADTGVAVVIAKMGFSLARTWLLA